MEFEIRTEERNQFIDITDKINASLRNAPYEIGICFISTPHTTAGLTINEGADPDVRDDILKTLSKVFPHHNNYSHAEGNSDAHIKSSLLGVSQFVNFNKRKLVLGQWQTVYFCEFDGPRSRKVIVNVLG
jgi:secondary thiamine-phosphate synthase enzyme